MEIIYSLPLFATFVSLVLGVVLLWNLDIDDYWLSHSIKCRWDTPQEVHERFTKNDMMRRRIHALMWLSILAFFVYAAWITSAVQNPLPGYLVIGSAFLIWWILTTINETALAEYRY